MISTVFAFVLVLLVIFHVSTVLILKVSVDQIKKESEEQFLDSKQDIE